MKKWSLAAGLGLAPATSAQVTDKIAIVNMGSLLQQVVQKIGVSNTLENEFRGRANELQHMGTDLQAKMKKLQSMKVGNDRTKLEKDVVARRQTFAQEAQALEQDRARRSNEERGKLVTRTQIVVKSVANNQDIDLVVDVNAVTYNSSDVKDIAADVSKQIKQVMPSIRPVDLAQQLDVKLYDDGDIIVTGIASMRSAQTGHITFMVNPRYREHLGLCQASAIAITQDGLPFAKSATLVVKNPYLTYVRMAQTLDTTPQSVQNIASSAVISATTRPGSSVSTGVNTATESSVELGDNVIIGAGCSIDKNSKIGASPRLRANVTIYHKIQIGQNCLIQPGVVVGADGFGYANNRGNRVKIPWIGRVIIGDHVETGVCTAVDRDALDDAIIGNGVIIDNQCQTAYNVVTSDDTAVAGSIIMAGDLKTSRYCMIGGASVVNRHMEMCDEVTVTGMGTVMRPITEPGVYPSGILLWPNKVWRKTAALVMNIDDMGKCLKSLECKVSQQG